MKVLFLMDSPEYLRFYDTVVEESAARGHSVVIAVNHQREKKPVGVEGLQAYADRVTVLGVVPRRGGWWRNAGRYVRASMDFVRFLHPAFVGAPALRARMKRKVLPRALGWLDGISSLSVGGVRRVERVLATFERAIPPYAPISEMLRTEAPDVLLVSPLVAAASEQVEWIKAAQGLGIRTAVCVASWDNLTNKGLLRVEPDRVMVWNEAQKREAQDFHYVPPHKVDVTGAQLFDRWFDKTVTRAREAFCERVGLPDSEPFVLFTGSSSFISESSAEVAFVQRWIAALRQSAYPHLRRLNVLVRPHPYNFHRWADEPVADLSGVAVYPTQGYSPIGDDNRNDFFDSLFHSAAVVGINTSAMVEAAIVGRPVCSLLAPEFAGTQEGTIHFHHLVPEHGGFLRLAASLDEHVGQLAEVLDSPEAVDAQLRGFVSSFIRPHGLDRPATPVFVDAVERLAREPAPVPTPEPVWHHLARPPLLVGTVVVWMIELTRDPDALNHFGKHVRGVVRRMRKRADTVMWRARKRINRSKARWKRFFERAW